MEQVLILSANKWKITDEKTGEVTRRGSTLHYLSDYQDEATDVSIGTKPIKITSSDEVFEVVKKGGAPAVYEMDFRTRAGSDGKPTLTAVKAKLVKPANLFA